MILATPSPQAIEKATELSLRLGQPAIVYWFYGQMEDCVVSASEFSMLRHRGLVLRAIATVTSGHVRLESLEPLPPGIEGLDLAALRPAEDSRR